MVGPLAALPEPHTYDLCQAHAHSLTAPRGWELVRPEGDLTPPPPPPDDLAALAEAVREGTNRPDPPGRSAPSGPAPPGPAQAGPGGHLRVVPPT